MFKVTALRLSTKKANQVSIYINNIYTFSVERSVVDKIDLRVGQELSGDQIQEIKEIDLVEKGIKAAFRYLSFRSRSEKEIRQRLSKHGFDSVIEKVVKRLQEQGLVNDFAFARFWKDSRLSFKPRSRRILRQELKQKGITEEVIAEILGDVDDNANAIAVGRKKVRLLASSDYAEFHRRLATYLRRRGFSYDTINSTVTLLWQEAQSGRNN